MNTPTRPMTLDDVEIFLLEREAEWRKNRSADYVEFIDLIHTARVLSSGIKAMLGVIDRLETLRQKMAGGDTIRYMGNGIRKDNEQDRKDDAAGIVGPTES